MPVIKKNTLGKAVQESSSAIPHLTSLKIFLPHVTCATDQDNKRFVGLSLRDFTLLFLRFVMCRLHVTPDDNSVSSVFKINYI
ncbi:hypothetical protein C0J52_02329 [Blattella germanica]|nr:hypothetical protein C0J52_02329 [Blattella germanica]